MGKRTKQRIVAVVGGGLMVAGMSMATVAPAASASSAPASVPSNHRDWDDRDDWNRHCRWWNPRWDRWNDWGRSHGRWDRWCWDRNDDWDRWRHHDRDFDHRR
jgi:hypothetical protein